MFSARFTLTTSALRMNKTQNIVNFNQEASSPCKLLNDNSSLAESCTLGLESVHTPKKFIQKRRTLFCFCSRLDNNQGGVNTFEPKCTCQCQYYTCRRRNIKETVPNLVKKLVIHPFYTALGLFLLQLINKHLQYIQGWIFPKYRHVIHPNICAFDSNLR